MKGEWQQDHRDHRAAHGRATAISPGVAAENHQRRQPGGSMMAFRLTVAVVAIVVAAVWHILERVRYSIALGRAWSMSRGTYQRR